MTKESSTFLRIIVLLSSKTCRMNWCHSTRLVSSRSACVNLALSAAARPRVSNKIKIARQTSWGAFILTAVLLVVCLPGALDAQTISITAADLQDSSGNPMPTNAVAVLVVDIGTSGFVDLQPSFSLSLGATWGTENKVVAIWNLSNCGCGDGILMDEKVLSYTGGITSNQALELCWFPSLTMASTTLGITDYGTYTDPVGIDGSDAWRTPAKKSSVSLAFLTANEGGSNPQEAGEATNVTAVPLTAFQTWQIHYFGSTNNPNAAPEVDADGTGMSNTNKFLSGFNPANSATYLHVISVAKTNTIDMNVIYLGANGDNTWSPGLASRTNVLEFTAGTANGSYAPNNFASTGKTNILSGGTGFGVVTNMIDPGGATNVPSRFYRVRVLLP